MNDFYGLPIDKVESKHLKIDFLTSVGPRIVGLHFKDHNLMAHVPKLKIDTPNGEFYFYGGHRFWIAPEKLSTTYFPDDKPPKITRLNSFTVQIREQVIPTIGIEKSLMITLSEDQPSVKIDHTISNHGDTSVRLAPWGLTQLIMDGIAILPQRIKPDDGAGFLPNRNLILWPYSSWDDDRVLFNDDFYFIKAIPKKQAFKLGYMNTHGWIAYIFKDILFCKRFFPQPGTSHPDMNCNAEIYVRDQFIELETLGPLVAIKPGESTVHLEVWELFDLKEQVVSLNNIREVISQTLMN